MSTGHTAHRRRASTEVPVGDAASERDRSSDPRNSTKPSIIATHKDYRNQSKARRKQDCRSRVVSREPSPTRSSAHAVQRKQSKTGFQSPSAPPFDHLRPIKSPQRPLSSGLQSSDSGQKTECSALPAPAPSIVVGRTSLDGKDDTTDSMESGITTPRLSSSIRERSLPSTPTAGASKALADHMAALAARQTVTVQEESDKDGGVQDSHSVRKTRTPSIASSFAPTSQAESESESGYRSDDRPPLSSASNVPTTATKPFNRRPTVVGKDASSRNMTVETETVSSVPQVGLSVGVPGGASIRSKKSTDTIRPKKEKKRATKRAGTSGGSNTATKADIFAARIAEAVYEANSSDSEETFVYESNPPEPSSQRPASRFHSRTPSATSVHGVSEVRGQRLPLSSAIDGTQTTGRKNMKFVGTLNKEGNLVGDSILGDGAGAERGIGSARELQRGPRDKNNLLRSHNGHRSILADDSPFQRPASHKASAQSLRISPNSHSSSRPPSSSTSPRHLSFRHNNGGGRGKRPPRSWAPYQGDEGIADDEEMPLISSARASRGYARSRRGNGSVRQLRNRSCFRRYAGCFAAIFAIILVCAGVGGFLLATTNNLQHVRLISVSDVLASKEQIFLDLNVEAINPNIISLSIGSMDINLFAKSSQVRESLEGGYTTQRRLHGGSRRGRTSDGLQSNLKTGLTGIRHKNHSFRANGNVDEGTDPPDDLPELDKETMLLGRVFHFDSGLTFDGTPFKNSASIATGELRLAKPGNLTEEGGTERWERVLQHRFELIVRGVLKYQLPLSGKIRTAPISGSIMVKGQDEPDTLNQRLP